MFATLRVRRVKIPENRMFATLKTYLKNSVKLDVSRVTGFPEFPNTHLPLTDVMTERPSELIHMDLVSPSRVQSMGGKWYVLVVVDDYSRYAWAFFLEEKGETFGFFRDLVLRLRMRGTEMPYERSIVTMAQNLKTLASKPFAMTWVLNTSFRARIRLPIMAWWKGKIEPCVR
jgi:hypothetical protein